MKRNSNINDRCYIVTEWLDIQNDAQNNVPYTLTVADDNKCLNHIENPGWVD